MGFEMVSETFARHIDETFELTREGGEPFEAVLSSCTESPYGSPDEWLRTIKRVPFMLVFHAEDPSRYWPQGMFTLRHRELGEFKLFMSPLGPDERGMGYQSVIS
jgi:hypothetical protein